MIFKFYYQIKEIFDKIDIFNDFLGEKDCHTNDYFTSNNFCEIYQTDIIFNEFSKSWISSTNDFKFFFSKTNHICLTREIFTEFQKLKINNKINKLDFDNDIVFSGLNILTAHNMSLFDLNKKIQSNILMDLDDKILELIENDEVQKNLIRIQNFLSQFKKDFLLKKSSDKNIIQKNYKISNNLFKFSFDASKFYSETVRENRFILEDFLMLIPPIDKMKILTNSNLNYLLKWRISADFIIISDFKKRYDIQSISNFLKSSYSYLSIDFEEIIGVVDKRNLNKSTARIIIFSSIDI